MSHTSIKYYFIRSSAREFLTMGNHQNKYSIPSMGGLIFITLPCYLLYYYHFSLQSIAFFIITISSYCVGLWDDRAKKLYNKGIAAKPKFILQGLGALIGSIILHFSNPSLYNYVHCGFFTISSSILFIAWSTFIIIATSHAVNLTDGIDGLATSQSIICSFSLFLFSEEKTFSSFGASLLLILLVSFLLFNKHPAKIIMGDVGALFLGSALAIFFIIERKEWFLITAGIVFVLETLSVILQYIWYKTFKKRLFLFAPIHHHFEKKGHSEKNIVLVSSLISIVGFFINYITIKTIL
jgi:phospho-N-acetylmuramoyl-pentapeptide-transferase